MAAQNYTGMIWRAEKVAEAKAFQAKLKAWRNDLRPMSPEYNATSNLITSLNDFGKAIGGEPLSSPARAHTANPPGSKVG